jgi:hypothetical protein
MAITVVAAVLSLTASRVLLPRALGRYRQRNRLDNLGPLSERWVVVHRTEHR